jgi:broad specificity phosphatase PhoE
MAKIILLKYPQSQLDVLPPDSPFPTEAKNRLTEDGRRVAQQIAENLARSLKGKFHIHSSPSARCTEPAEILAARLGGQVKSDPDLVERHMFRPKAKFTIRDFRLRQERSYLDPAHTQEDEPESPLSHRLRVEGWLWRNLGGMKPRETHVVVSHGAVIEHLHASLSWRPAGAMAWTFTFCAPGHAHLWSNIELPNGGRVWCCLGANVNLAVADSFETHFRGFKNLDELAVDLASDPRFQQLVAGSASKPLGDTIESIASYIW